MDKEYNSLEVCPSDISSFLETPTPAMQAEIGVSVFERHRLSVGVEAVRGVAGGCGGFRAPYFIPDWFINSCNSYFVKHLPHSLRMPMPTLRIPMPDGNQPGEIRNS